MLRNIKKGHLTATFWIILIAKAKPTLGPSILFPKKKRKKKILHTFLRFYSMPSCQAGWAPSFLRKQNTKLIIYFEHMACGLKMTLRFSFQKKNKKPTSRSYARNTACRIPERLSDTVSQGLFLMLCYAMVWYDMHGIQINSKTLRWWAEGAVTVFDSKSLWQACILSHKP